MNDVTLVRQEHDYGCGIASLAMVSGLSYDDVRRWLLDNWPGGHERTDDWLEKRGIYKGIADYFLASHGYVWRTLYGGWKLSPWPPEPFAPVHLVRVRQPSGTSHFVVMDGNGSVLDPLLDEPRCLADWSEVDNVQGIWPGPASDRQVDRIAELEGDLADQMHLTDDAFAEVDRLSGRSGSSPDTR